VSGLPAGDRGVTTREQRVDELRDDGVVAPAECGGVRTPLPGFGLGAVVGLLAGPDREMRDARTVDRDRAVGAVEFGRRLPAFHRRRVLDRADRAVLELHRNRRRVLTLQFPVDVLGDRADRLDAAHEPRQQVDLVDRLVHQRAAVHVPGATPAGRVVVGLRAKPLLGRISQHGGPEFAAVDGLLCPPVRAVEPLLEDAGEGDTRPIARLDRPVHPVGVDVQWLLAEHVRPCLGGLDDHVGVSATRGTDAHRVDVALRDHRRRVPVGGRDAVFVGERRGGAGVDIRTRHQLGPVGRVHRTRVGVPDPRTADDAVPDWPVHTPRLWSRKVTVVFSAGVGIVPERPAAPPLAHSVTAAGLTANGTPIQNNLFSFKLVDTINIDVF